MKEHSLIQKPSEFLVKLISSKQSFIQEQTEWVIELLYCAGTNFASESFNWFIQNPHRMNEGQTDWVIKFNQIQFNQLISSKCWFIKEQTKRVSH